MISTPLFYQELKIKKQGIKTNLLVKIVRGFKMTPAEFLTKFEKMYEIIKKFKQRSIFPILLE